jgi:hypothetical protein
MLVVVSLLAALVWTRPAVLVSQALPRAMHVSVVDQAGMPVPDLGLADFIVREDNLSREILRVAPADDPMQIAILVDDSTAARDVVIDIRRALPGFVDALLAPGDAGRKNQISIIGLGQRPTVLSDYTTDRAQLGKAIDRVWQQVMAGNYLLDATMEVIQGFKKRDASRPVIVALTTDGTELSTAGYDRVLQALGGSTAMFNVISLGRPAPATDDQARSRDIVVSQGPDVTGGFHDRLLATMALTDKLQQVANVLTHEYLVTYAHPDTLIPPEHVTVSVRRSGLTARGRLVKNQQGPQGRP